MSLENLMILQNMSKQALMHTNTMQNLAQRRVGVLYSVEVASQVLQKGTISNLLLSIYIYIYWSEKNLVFSKKVRLQVKRVTK